MLSIAIVSLVRRAMRKRWQSKMRMAGEKLSRIREDGAEPPEH
jgi:hypothetical protein